MESLKETLIGVEEKGLYVSGNIWKGIKTIISFWIIGMSIAGTPFLVLYIGYKGFSLGYTISTLIKVFGTLEANKYVFQNLFLSNTILIFILIFMANYSIKILKNFLDNKENIKIDAIKYSIISAIMCTLYMFISIAFSMME